MLDEAAREARLAAFAGLLNALTHPIQILIRITPLNLAPYLAALEGRTRRELSPVLAAVGDDHAAFLRRIAVDHLLLDRTSTSSSPTTTAADARRFGRRRRARPGGGRDAPRAARRRCEDLIRSTSDAATSPPGGSTRVELAYLYRDWWCPDRAAIAAPGARARRPRRAGRPRPRARPQRPSGASRGGRRGRDGFAPRARRRVPGWPTSAPRAAVGRRRCTPTSRASPPGRRGIADLIAPAAIEVGRDWLRLDGDLRAGPLPQRLPRARSATGWLGQLVGFDEPLDLALHIAPLDTARMIRDARQPQARPASRRRAGRSPTSGPGSSATRRARSRSSRSTPSRMPSSAARSASSRSPATSSCAPRPPPTSTPGRRGSAPRSRGCWLQSRRGGALRAGRCARALPTGEARPARACPDLDTSVPRHDLPVRRRPGLDGPRRPLRPDARTSTPC